MAVDIAKITIQGNQLLEDFVEKMGLECAVMATPDGLEMASYLSNNGDAEMTPSDAISLLSVANATLGNVKKGTLEEIVITSSDGYVAIKDLGDDITLAVVAPEDYKMGGLIIALSQFAKEIESI